MSKDSKLSFQELEKARTSKPRTSLPFSIWLHDIRSVYNVGSVFRTCDASGASNLYLSGYSPYPPRADITKTALGAESSVPFIFENTAESVISAIRSKNKKIISIELTREAIPYTLLDAQDLDSVFVFGNEVSGLPQDIIDSSDKSVYLPMMGMKHSLNVAVTVGIIAYKMQEIALYSKSSS